MPVTNIVHNNMSNYIIGQKGWKGTYMNKNKVAFDGAMTGEERKVSLEELRTAAT